MKFLTVLLFLITFQAGATGLDFELPDLDGQPHSLGDYRGQWVVVNYWATWCRPCRKEIPDLSRLHAERDDITVLGLTFEDIDTEAVKIFLEDYPASYPILMVDVYEPPPELGAPRVLPTTFLIDPGGVLLETWLGPVTSQMISRWIDEQH